MKKIELEIKNCSECPYLTYNPNYGISYDSGYDCKKSHNRIIDDWEYNNTNNPNRIVKDYDNYYPIPMPDWCPLEDKKGFDFGKPTWPAPDLPRSGGRVDGRKRIRNIKKNSKKINFRQTNNIKGGKLK